jgi:hypothetical protein
MQKNLTRFWIALMLFAAVAACTSLDLGGSNGPAPTPSSSATTSPTPGVCSTPTVNANLVVVAMGNNIGPTYTSKYGVINGYGVVENGDFPTQAMLIDQWLNPSGGTGPITSKNVLQFTNVDTGFVLHSAVGFKGDSFPSVPYTFPSAAASPVATAVSTNTLWSTGRIEAPVSAQCYSQTFTLTAGTYYFGDLDYYNLSNFRDVLIVATPPAPSLSRHARPRRHGVGP